MDVSVDEIIEACPYITNNLLELLEDFEAAVEQFDEQDAVYTKILSLEDVTYCSRDTVLHLQINFLNGVNGDIHKNENYLKKIKQKIEDLKKSENDLLCSVAKNENHLKKSQAKTSNLNKKKDFLQKNRDKIQICKLLTNTSFIYEGNNIRGYVTGEASKETECFDLNPEKLSESGITEHLCDLLKKVNRGVV